MSVYRAAVAFAAFANISACAYLNELTPEAAHRNFLNNLGSYIGEDINANKEWLRNELKLSREDLANGLIRYRYGVGGGCIKVFDVNPATSKIVAVGFEGTERQCAIPG
jgi:hypothetical protein